MTSVTGADQCGMRSLLSPDTVAPAPPGGATEISRPEDCLQWRHLWGRDRIILISARVVGDGAGGRRVRRLK